MTSSGPSTRQDRREALRVDRRQRQRKQQAAQRRRRLLTALAAVVVVAVIAVISIILITGQDDSSGGDLAPMVAVADPYPGLPQQTKLLGDPNAPLKLVEYGDYQCVACHGAQQTVVPTLIQRYVATGTVSFEFRDFLVIDRGLASQRGSDYDYESLRAAEGAMCAGDQGQYWAFHESLYRNWTGEGVGDFSESRVRDLAAKLGLDTAAFNGCLDNKTYQSAVQQQDGDASAAGVSGTPTFMIGDQKISGSTVDDDIAQIDAILVANGITPPAAVATPPPANPAAAVAPPVAILPDRKH